MDLIKKKKNLFNDEHHNGVGWVYEQLLSECAINFLTKSNICNVC